jgi:hypothetical protein
MPALAKRTYVFTSAATLNNSATPADNLSSYAANAWTDSAPARVWKEGRGVEDHIQDFTAS